MKQNNLHCASHNRIVPDSNVICDTQTGPTLIYTSFVYHWCMWNSKRIKPGLYLKKSQKSTSSVKLYEGDYA